MSDKQAENLNKMSLDDEEEEDDDEEVLDDVKNLPEASEMDLLASIEECKAITDLFLNNKHEQALQRAAVNATKGIYGALTEGCLRALKVFITFDGKDISEAATTLKKSAAFCNHRRKKSSLKIKIGKKNYSAFTEEQAHAELCYAECVLLRALITFVQDENLLNIVKGGLRFRKSFQCYNLCVEILKGRTWNNEALKRNFQSGIYMGIGLFNLILSCLPKRILKLVEFAGFSGKRSIGNEKLDLGRQMEDTLRGPLCSLVVLGFHTLVSYYFGRGCTTLSYVEDIVKPWVANYPSSALAQFFAARLENIKGNSKQAIQQYENILKLDMEWKNTYHLPYFELAWSHGNMSEWRNALKYVDILVRENRWTPCTFSYLKAVLLMSCPDVTEAEKKEILSLFANLPNQKIRYSGKSFPLEKFFCRKAERYVAQNNYLVLPAYEVLYIGNSFLLMKGKPELLEPILAKVEATMNEVKKCTDCKYYVDNYCTTVFFKGLCLAYMGKTAEAQELFKEVISNQKKIKMDIYLPACANLELAIICMEAGNYPQAISYLKAAKKEKTFWPEFRIHQAREEIRLLTEK